MNNRRFVVVMLVSLGVVVLWYYTNLLLSRKYPQWYTQPTTQPTEGPTTRAVAGTQASTRPATAPVLTTAPAMASVRPMGPARSVELGHFKHVGKGESSPYVMGVALTARGAAVQSVTLNRYTQTVEKDDPYHFQLPYAMGPAELRYALAARAVVVNGVTFDLASVDWGLESGPAGENQTATYAVEVPVGGPGKSLIVRKIYELPTAADKSMGYEVRVRYQMENNTGTPLSVRLAFNGPNIPLVDSSRDIPEVVVGHNNDQLVYVTHAGATDYTVEKGAVSLENAKRGPVLWAGMTTAYFNGIVRPEIREGKAAQIALVKAQGLGRAEKTGQELVTQTWETVELAVAAGQRATVPLNVYFGPRWRGILNKEYYASFPLGYDRTLVLTSGACAWCTFQWLINLLVAMLSFFHLILRDWGLAIIALVIVVRLLLHPITKRSQISMSRMGKMGPEIERLKQKYGDNKDELNRAMMQLYKEQGITPILGCLPMMLQMPIWIALWSALQSTFELRHASFLWGWTWIHDLAQPDRLVYFPRWGFAGINFFGWFTLDAINLLPLLLAVVFYLQQKMTPQPAATTPEQEQQQKMMRWMSLLFPVLLYSGPSGLNLYILTSTAIGIWESKRVRDHLKEQEEREKGGKVIVDARPTKASRRLPRGEQAPAEPAGCIGGWIANLQNRVRKIQDDAERKYGKGK